MKNRTLLALWGFLYILCAGLGFIPEPAGLVKYGMTALSLVFFLPPAALLYRGKRDGHGETVRLIRKLSALALGSAVVLLVVNILAVRASENLGQILHGLLVILTSPMICSGYWAMSLFLWACLLVGSWK